MSPHALLEWLAWSVLLFVLLIVNGQISIYFYKRRQKRNGLKFIKWVKVQYPESTVTYISVDSSDEGALEKLKKQVEEGILQ